MTSYTLRPYRADDCGAIARLFYDTVHTVNAKDYNDRQLNVWATGKVDIAQWDASFRAHHTLVAVDAADTVVGFADMDETGYLDRLYVHRRHQREGIASALTAALERSALEQGSRQFITHASITAKPFFEKAGYVAVRENTVLRAGVALTNYIMIKTAKE